MAQQRNIMIAALDRANDNGGFLPLAGKITVREGTKGLGGLPVALNDSDRRRYAYHPARSFLVPTFEYPASPLAAIAPYLDVPYDMSQWVCPSAAVGNDVAARPVVSLDIAGEDEYILFTREDDFNSYGINAGVSGFHHSQSTISTRLRGNLSASRDPSQVMWLSDAANDGPGVQLSVFTPRLDTEVPVSLADARDLAASVESSAGFDPYRHRGSINVVFLDGHGETHRIESDKLARIYFVVPDPVLPRR